MRHGLAGHGASPASPDLHPRVDRERRACSMRRDDRRSFVAVAAGRAVRAGLRCCSSCSPLAASSSIVSFWDYNEYEMIPAFTLRSYIDMFEGCIAELPDLCTIAEDLSDDAEILPARLGPHACDRLHRSPISSPSTSARTTWQIVLFAALHDPVLDLERDPHDLVDSAARPQRPGQPGADRARGLIDAAARVAAVLRLLGGAGLRPPLHVVHDRADLQLDDAHRPAR